jgi:ABC-type branched-subunit amino acid transport system ATPase component
MFKCEHLSKTFGGVHALTDVSLEFPPSGSVAVIGPNGAGKTTLFNILTGFLRPDTGKCFLGGRDVTRLSPYRIARLGVSRTFQELRLIQQISVLDNVLLACPWQQGEHLLADLIGLGAAEATRNREKAMRLLRYVELAEKSRQAAGALSYGEQKLLTLACCLAREARVLLLDEPITGVHQAMTARMLELLRKLPYDGRLVIFIEHNINAVRQIADLVVIMSRGKIITQGYPSVVLNSSAVTERYLV